jgi:hypothetical protein
MITMLQASPQEFIGAKTIGTALVLAALFYYVLTLA